MKCKNCGNVVSSNMSFCTNCGARLDENMIEREVVNNNVNEGSSFGWGVLGFFFPLVGLILFLCWKSNKPKSSKASGIGALIGVIIWGVLGTVLAIIIGFAFDSAKGYIENNFSEDNINKYIDEFNDALNDDIDKISPTTQGYTLGDSFEFDGFEITLGSTYSFDSISGSDVVVLPISIKNNSDYAKKFNTFYIKYYNNEGVSTTSRGSFFDNSIEKVNSINSSDTVNTNLYFVYNEDGGYEIEFNKITEDIKVSFVVTK